MREVKKIIDPAFNDHEYARIVGEVKRFLEKWSLDADFRKAYDAQPEQTLAQSGLDVDPETARLLTDTQTAREKIKAIKEGRDSAESLPEKYLLYKHFIMEKLCSRNEMRTQTCVPSEPRLKNWRDRQEKRCRLSFGTQSLGMVQAVVMFELSQGCSVGCPFCGFSAKKLSGVFRYTEENAALWRAILKYLHAFLGDAAGSGACYCASEGLDNPDYEKLIDDFYHEFGIVPQLTTAASTRNVERTRALLRYGRERYPHIDRFSVLNAEMRDKIFESFTLEELLLVELLPQFPEAPASHLTKTGRNWKPEQGEEAESTIACASGFVINMQEKSIRLVTPFPTDSAHPTGEWMLEKRFFENAADFESKITGLIEKYMPQRLALSAVCGSVDKFGLEKKDGKVWVSGRAVCAPLLASALTQETLDRLLLLLEKRSMTGYEILSDLLEDDSVDAAHALLLIKTLWKYGLVDTAAFGETQPQE